jgi:DNA polymerase
MDPSTEVLCMAYAFDDEDVQLWLPGQPFPDLTGCQIRAHNSSFERLVLWYVLEMGIPLESFYCTATQARANCLPGSLEDVGRALSSQMRKDHRGNELVRKCCIPPFDTEALPELYEYCKQDVRAMRDISKSMRDLSPEELADYHVNERINDRGVLADVELRRHAVLERGNRRAAEHRRRANRWRDPLDTFQQDARVGAGAIGRTGAQTDGGV